MKISPPKNKNYCATIVEIKSTMLIPNCDNVVYSPIFGNSVIVGKDTPIGQIGLFFPIETKLSNEFLKNNNLFRKYEFNADQNKKGYFEEHGRIKAVKFRGNKSEGFFIPINSLRFILTEEEIGNLSVGTEFDVLKDVRICEKYIPRGFREQSNKTKTDKKAVKISRLVENQFRLHVDTEQLKKNIHKLNPNDVISITNKLHGTSFVVGRVLVNKKLNLFEKLLKKFGINIVDKEYDTIYSSRKVVKNQYLSNKEHNHFYQYDIWEEIKNELEENILDGITLYGEAVGYLKDGKFIQKGYHYGCSQNQFETYIYRITHTNSQGKVIEFSWQQVKEYCNKFGMKHVPEFYHGLAKDCFPLYRDLNGDLWRERFLDELLASFNLNDSFCELNNKEVPAEGVCLKIDRLNECDVFKLKNFSFLEHETKMLDKGEVDIETNESEQTNE